MCNGRLVQTNNFQCTHLAHRWSLLWVNFQTKTWYSFGQFFSSGWPAQDEKNLGNLYTYHILIWTKFRIQLSYKTRIYRCSFQTTTSPENVAVIAVSLHGTKQETESSGMFCCTSAVLEFASSRFIVWISDPLSWLEPSRLEKSQTRRETDHCIIWNEFL